MVNQAGKKKANYEIPESHEKRASIQRYSFFVHFVVIEIGIREAACG